MAEFVRPSNSNKDTEQYIDTKKDTTNNETSLAGDKASSSTRGLAEQQYGTSGTSLNKNQNANYAKQGGQYGSINNKDYKNTLRLARMADAYNARPATQLHGYNKNGYVSLGTVDKPQLNTVEQRVIDQAFQLDTNQKQLAQSLQDAVNRKDLETFQMLYKQLYGIELSKMQAEMEMTKLARQLQIQQMMTKDLVAWQSEFQRAFGEETAAVLMELGRSNPQYAAMLGNIIAGGTIPPAQVEIFAQDFIDTAVSRYKEQGDNTLTAYNKAIQDLTVLQNKQNNELAYTITRGQNYGNKRDAKKTVKAREKENENK